MDIRPIKTKKDYDAALARIEFLMDAQMDSPEGDELDVLATLVEVYESKRHQIASEEEKPSAVGEPVGKEYGSPDCDYD